MNKLLLTYLVTLSLTSCFGQSLVSNREQIDKAKTELNTEITNFSSCVVKSDLNSCKDNLVKSADNEYKKYLIGGMLYDIDAKQSFRLHEEAYLTNKREQNFILEYALELHRIGQYKEASKFYELYSENILDDIRIYVWLADCYLNIGEIDKSISNWNKANHPKNHTSIDFAIYTVHSKATQMIERNNYKLEIDNGDIKNFYPLIFLDLNWEMDWWNKTPQEYFLNEDIEFAKNKLGASNSDFKVLQAYIEIKKLERQGGQSDAIKRQLTDNKIILDNNSIPAFGGIASDLLSICFTNGLISESDFYFKRGEELLEFAKQTKDKDILNIYAYLQASVDGKVKPEIDKLGWKEFKDERFAISYFIGKADKNRYDDIELKEALEDFPNSAKLYWIKTKCAKIESKPLKPHLIELIKREFKTLGSDQSRYSYGLKFYFANLEAEK